MGMITKQTGMDKRLDYRKIENRQKGFDFYYQFTCETNDCSPDIAIEKWIADDLNFDYEKRCVMALFHGATYAGPCESMFADKFPLITPEVIPNIIEFFNKEKKRLLFSPDCKYRKMVFPEFLESIGESIKPYGTLGNAIRANIGERSKDSIIYDTGVYRNQPKENYLNLQAWCFKNWFHWGRMGHWCFAEALARFVDAPIDPPNMEFATGKSHRAGWAFCLGLDNLTGETITPKECEMLEDIARQYMQRCSYPRASYFTLETACCNYKRQHKGSRYGGCYIDEQHTEMMQMKNDWPEYDWLWDKYLEGRQVVIPKGLLYESNEHHTKHAYISSWCNALVDYGRIPRVEAYFNSERQQWVELDQLQYTRPNESTLEGLFS